MTILNRTQAWKDKKMISRIQETELIFIIIE